MGDGDIVAGADGEEHELLEGVGLRGASLGVEQSDDAGVGGKLDYGFGGDGATLEVEKDDGQR